MGQSYDLGGGGNSFPFDNIGDAVIGKIINITEVQQTDMDSGQPATWDNGQPKMMVAVELQTTLRDPQNLADDGKRTVYLKGSKKPESLSSMAAVLKAVKEATGSTQLNVGGELGLRYVGDGVPPTRGKNPPKQYEARYTAPAVNLDPGNQWNGQAAQQAQDAAGFAQAQQAGGPPPQYTPPAAGAGWGAPPTAAQTPPNGLPEQSGWGGNQPNAAPPAQAAPPPPNPADDPAYAAYLAWQQSQQG